MESVIFCYNQADMRVLSSDIKKHAGKTIEVRGWLRIRNAYWEA